MLVASGRMVEVENMKSEKYYWEYSFLFRHEVLWKILEQIPHSRLGLLAKVHILQHFCEKYLFIWYYCSTRPRPSLFSIFQGCVYSQTKTDAEILQYASEYNLVDNEYFFDRYYLIRPHVIDFQYYNPPKNDQL